MQATIYRVQGRIAAADIEKTIVAFYDKVPTLNVVWDFSEADLSKVTIGEIEQLAKTVNAVAHSRTTGKSAIISPHDISFGLSRVYQAFADAGEAKSITKVFRDEQEALDWLKS